MRTQHGHRFLIATLMLCLVASGSAVAKSHKKKPPAPSDFAYYLLVLSYAPDFCNQPQGDKDPRECGVGRHVGFIVHGLWPQGETTRGPQNCGGAKTIPKGVVQATLSYIPTESLMQHEWTTHGTCSGLSATRYFETVRKARDAITIPADLDQPAQQLQLSPAQVEAKVAEANPKLPPAGIRTSCYRDGELQEIRVCLNKDLSPRECGPSAGECTAASVTLLPVR